MGRIHNESRDWMIHAACRTHSPELFFPHPKDFRSQNMAINVCRPCPVRFQCGQYAVDHHTTEGVWAGRFFNGIAQSHILRREVVS
jgi:WhiB family redox-sensing transcriptional regulator